MAIYKVRITTEGTSTTYPTNATTLAAVAYNPESDKWDVSAPYTKSQINTQEEADITARESIIAFFASVGLSPEFINE